MWPIVHIIDVAHQSLTRQPFLLSLALLMPFMSQYFSFHEDLWDTPAVSTSKATSEGMCMHLGAALGDETWLGSQAVSGALLVCLSLHLRLSCEHCCVSLDI